ncbi:MAG: nuclear transport factor 2 family protein [Xanthobacteraceae bacterium]|nr:nuclear transport factor 2 family protein [Xanthobacteraceae bacterium]
MPDITEARLTRLGQLFAAFNLHDGLAVMACMTPDVEFDAAAGSEIFGRRHVGAIEVRTAFERTWTDMPDVSWECTRHAVFGDRGLSEWIFRATTGDGRPMEVNGCDIFEFRGDLICNKSAFRKERPMLALPSRQEKIAS